MGKKLARTLGWPFYDSDRVIEKSTGVSIPMIFDYEGEQGFRDREQEVIAELTGLNGIVLATGGGAILREENRRRLMDNGFVVYLQCSIDRILQRTRRDTQRPLLQTENPRQRLEQLLKERDPLYRQCADITVDTGIMQSKAALKTILREINHPDLT